MIYDDLIRLIYIIYDLPLWHNLDMVTAIPSIILHRDVSYCELMTAHVALWPAMAFPESTLSPLIPSQPLPAVFFTSGMLHGFGTHWKVALVVLLKSHSKRRFHHWSLITSNPHLIDVNVSQCQSIKQSIKQFYNYINTVNTCCITWYNVYNYCVAAKLCDTTWHLSHIRSFTR